MEAEGASWEEEEEARRKLKKEGGLRRRVSNVGDWGCVVRREERELSRSGAGGEGWDRAVVREREGRESLERRIGGRSSEGDPVAAPSLSIGSIGGNCRERIGRPTAGAKEEERSGEAHSSSSGATDDLLLFDRSSGSPRCWLPLISSLLRSRELARLVPGDLWRSVVCPSGCWRKRERRTDVAVARWESKEWR